MEKLCLVLTSPTKDIVTTLNYVNNYNLNKSNIKLNEQD